MSKLEDEKRGGIRAQEGLFPIKRSLISSLKVVYKDDPGKAAIKLLTSLYSSLYIQLHKRT
ncbi:hypothetical protein DAPPUDRAFT_331450 [Daphnia pulex]|uniref:Uncharacterized protein n=1 Tax=Daphnia pulex TaxID=6669 RepID=E9HMI8_DAPPU|nr:hypothetical protein DAPPUDRAFT_331450 [Daphnia pulex]|eukprot:EFX67028.1 hypothetical protein DAPPUDRAFT_331450 [Daphnia pulex]